MRRSRITDEQMVAILREADRISVAETAEKHKISDPTLYGVSMSEVYSLRM